jgi:metal-responsive CopG/Arc/MetJ family transcriptional regulator
MNITLPESLVRKLEKATDNKSAFIADAIVHKFATDRKEARRLERLEAFKWVAKHPEYERDARPDW